jgi:hypothetical protein
MVNIQTNNIKQVFDKKIRNDFFEEFKTLWISNHTLQ